MSPVSVDWVVILAAVVASFVIGMVWYSPLVFGTMWMKLAGVPKNVQKVPVVPMVSSVVGAAVMAYVLMHVLVYSSADTVADGVITAFWMWLGFVAPTIVVHGLYEKSDPKLMGLNLGYNLVSMLAMGTILMWWPW